MIKGRHVLLAAGAFALCVVGPPALHLVSVHRADSDTRTPPAPGHLDDASRLNATPVAEVWQDDGVDASWEERVAALLERARSEGRNVSIAGARHTMGGHTLYPGGIVLDTRRWNRMSLDAEAGILAVQSGATWEQVLAYLDPLGWSVSVMQSNNSFTVGGSLGANCHGWQFGHPPIASTVASFRLMKADGTVVRCSRTEHAELFSLALGGYGLFGVILDVELRVVPNQRYRRNQLVVPLAESLMTFDREIRDNPDAELVFARMDVRSDHRFEQVVINAYVREEGAPPATADAPLVGLRRTVFRGSAGNDYGKKLRWMAETRIHPRVSAEVVSRNALLGEGVTVYENRSETSTDILHEYFVPRRGVEGFVAAMRRLVDRHPADLLNVTVRAVDEDADSFLRYADQPMFAFVLLFVQPRTDEGEQQMQALTRELIDAAAEHGGRYYLPYRLHATPEQFLRAYPQAPEFFASKRHHDPGELFQNQFYRQYGAVGR